MGSVERPVMAGIVITTPRPEADRPYFASIFRDQLAATQEESLCRPFPGVRGRQGLGGRAVR